MLYSSIHPSNPYASLDYYYLDYMASTPMCEDALQCYGRLNANFANSQSIHRAGIEAHNMAHGSGSIHGSLGLRQLYCPNVSEGIRNLMLWFSLNKSAMHILVSRIEHKAILSAIELATAINPLINLHWIRNHSDGSIDTADLHQQLDYCLQFPNRYILVVSQSVNNELGTIQPLSAIRKLLWDKPNVVWISDWSQSWCKSCEPILDAFELLCPTVMLVSGHKIYGPKSIGSIIVDPTKVNIDQHAIYSGTLDTQSICAFHQAEEWCSGEFASRDHIQDLLAIKQYIRDALRHYIRYDLSPSNSVPWCSMFYMPSIVVGDFILGSNSVMVSNGSACSRLEPSHVLTACGYDREWISHCMRISWDPLFHDMDYIKHACQALVNELDTYLELYE